MYPLKNSKNLKNFGDFIVSSSRLSHSIVDLNSYDYPYTCIFQYFEFLTCRTSFFLAVVLGYIVYIVKLICKKMYQFLSLVAEIEQKRLWVPGAELPTNSPIYKNWSFNMFKSSGFLALMMNIFLSYVCGCG